MNEGDAFADAEGETGIGVADASDKTGNPAGCGCRTVQTNEAALSPALLAFGAIALLGGRRLRRRSRAGR
jgi:hypothetical protein